MPVFPINMPQLGDSIAEAIVREALVSPGDTVQADQNLFEVETDKAMMEVTTPCAGTIVEIIAVIGTSYPVGSPIAVIEATTEDAIRAGLLRPEDSGEIAIAKAATSAAANGEASAEGNAKADENLHFAVDQSEVITQKAPLSVQPTIEGGLPVPVRSSVYLSPRLRHRMEELGLNSADLAGLPGSGAGGRVTVEDFEKFIRELDESRMTDASPMRIAVADSMRRSWTRPLATVTVPVGMDALLAHRASLSVKPGITLYVMRALALAIAENTAVAGRLIGSKIIHPNVIDIGFAVEAEDGVLVPVVRHVDQHSLSDLLSNYDDLVRLARERRLPKSAMGGGIATITNVGPFGITAASPIPLPEQNLVLGLMAGRRVPVWDSGTNTFVPRMESNFTLSFDHRILDGGAAGRLLLRIAEVLQSPESL